MVTNVKNNKRKHEEIASSTDAVVKKDKKDKKDKKNKKEKSKSKHKKSRYNPEELENGSKSSKSSKSGSRIETLSPEVLQSLKNEPPYTFVNTMQVEHAVSKFVEMYKIIQELSPNLAAYQNLIKNKDNTELDLVPALSRYMLKLAAELKTLDILNKCQPLKAISEYEANFKDGDANPTLKGITQEDIDMLKNASKTIMNKDTEAASTGKPASNGNDSAHKKSSSSWPPPLPQIKDAAIRARVFTHKSLVKDKDFLSEQAKLNSHNEMLEFLGDAALYFAVTRIIYRRFPEFDDGQLTELRMQLVNNERLKTFSVAYGLSDKLRTSIKLMENEIYKQGKRKVEADIFEAYIGGLVEDNPTTYAQVIEEWLEILMNPTIDQLTKTSIKLQKPQAINLDAKRQLYSLIGYAALGLCYKVVKGKDQKDPIFIVECRVGDGTVLGVGRGKNVKMAGTNAAENVLANKELVAKYISQRAAIPRNVSMVSKNGTPPPKLDDKKKPAPADDKQIVMGKDGQFIMK